MKCNVYGLHQASKFSKHLVQTQHREFRFRLYFQVTVVALQSEARGGQSILRSITSRQSGLGAARYLCGCYRHPLQTQITRNIDKLTNESYVTFELNQGRYEESA